MKFKKLAVGLGVGLAIGCVAAQAQVISFQDDDVDFLLTSSLQPKTSGTFAVGDVLVSVFEMPTYTIGGVNQIPAGSELTGIAVIQIASITGSGLGSVITFQPYSGGFNAVSPVDVADGGSGEGATVAMWLNDTGTFDLQLEFGTTVGTPTNCTSRLQCLTEASTGSLIQVDGFAGDDDEFWTSVITAPGGADPAIVRTISGALGVAQFNALQTTFFNATGPIGFQTLGGIACPAGTTAADGCAAGPTITGPILGGAGLNAAIVADGAFARSDIDASKLLATPVPEPATLALLGVSLLGFAATRRRGQK
jgi:hypothetical protein